MSHIPTFECTDLEAECTLEQNGSSVCFLGAGYVGGPTGAVMASHLETNQHVYICDLNQSRIDAWNSGGKLPVSEPGLDSVVAKGLQRGNLHFTTDIKGAIEKSRIIFIAVNTPTKTTGSIETGKDCKADTTYVISCASSIADYATTDKIIVEKSTVPVHTSDLVKAILTREAHDGVNFSIVSNPEFLAEGTAIRDLEEPSRVLIGGDEEEAIEEVKKLYGTWVDDSRIVTTGLYSSELAKLLSNAMLAQRVSSVNSISRLCEAVGANVLEISKVMGMDSRIGSKFLMPSVGFGGSCFQKDVKNLVYICRHFDLNDVADYWESVISINDAQKKQFVHTIIKSMFGSITNKRICILGLAFKQNTGDVRETAAAYIIPYLLQEGAIVHCVDPEVEKNEFIEEAVRCGAAPEIMMNEDKLKFFNGDVMAASKDCDAIGVLTEWKVFREYDYGEILKSMNRIAFIFDGRNILDHKALRKLGFLVYALGQNKNGGVDLSFLR